VIVSKATVDDLLARIDAAAEGAPVEPVEVELRDGSTALLRPIVPSDKERLAEGLHNLSSRSRFLRFGSSVSKLTEEQLRYFTELDYDDHVALGAIDPEHPERPGMGVARYIRLKESPKVAELAVAVADEYQGRGLGTILLAVLVHIARARGVEVFRNYVLEQNDEMLEMLDQLGATRRSIGGGMYEVDMPIPTSDAAIPDTPAGRVLRSFAKRSWPWRLRRVLPPLWSRPGAEAPEAVEEDESTTWIDEYLKDLDVGWGS
jgi:GNAT superfamily N-acetyltransferase